MKIRWGVAIVMVLLVGGLIALFGWQNSLTRVDLVLSLGPLGAWHLAQGAPLPAALAIAFAIGFLVGGGLFGGRAFTASRRARRLQRQVQALQDEIEFNRRGSPTVSPPPSTLAPSKPAPPPEADPPDFDDLI